MDRDGDSEENAMKILIVEDELRTADYLSKGLTEQGCAVDMAHNGVDGQHLALTHDYDVIVLDVMLPGQDGFSVLRELRAVKQTPVVMLTARDRVADRIKRLRDKIDVPFSPKLLHTIRGMGYVMEVRESENASEGEGAAS